MENEMKIDCIDVVGIFGFSIAPQIGSDFAGLDIRLKNSDIVLRIDKQGNVIPIDEPLFGVEKYCEAINLIRNIDTEYTPVEKYRFGLKNDSDDFEKKVLQAIANYISKNK